MRKKLGGHYVKEATRHAALIEVKGLESRLRASAMTAFTSHPEKNTIRLQLRENASLQRMSAAQWAELEPLISIADYRKGEALVRQGDEEMKQFFILAGMV